jgi:hypothetical protein
MHAEQTGFPPAQIPPHLLPFWECYQAVKSLDHGRLGKGELFNTIYQKSYDALHSRACRKAAEAAALVVDTGDAVNATLYQGASAPAPAPAPAQAPAQAQAQAPAQAQAQAPAQAQGQAPIAAPAPAQSLDTAHAQHIAQSQSNHTMHAHHLALPPIQAQQQAREGTDGGSCYHAHHQHPTICRLQSTVLPSPMHPETLFQTPQQERDFAQRKAAHLGGSPDRGRPEALISAPQVPAFASPSVKLAAERESRALAAKSAATTLIIMPNNSAKIMQWKAGEEKDLKGFYWSTKLAVQQAWEQHNMVEEPQNHRTFRSTIHVTMISIICFELLIDRATFDLISDASLIELLDRRLKPTGPAEYLIKLRQIKFNNDEKSGTLLHRYRAFAEPFLQLVSEATDAGCPINAESTKLAFKAACRGNELLMMFLQEDRWTTAAAAHHRIVSQLRNFDSLTTMNSMNVNLSAATAPAPAVIAAPVQLQIPPPPIFAPAPPTQHSHQTRPQYAHRQQTAMVNVMSQLMERFDRFDRSQANPVVLSHAPQQQMNCLPPAAIVNAGIIHPAPGMLPTSSAQRAPRVHDLTPHPGLDARGPYWHPPTPVLECRFSPCTALFCQGCGRHGHTAAECIRKGAPGFNVSGYFADRYPNQSALMFPRPAGPPPIPAAGAAFPTPHQLNPPKSNSTAASRPQPPRYTPVARSNACIQTASTETPPTSGAPAVQ